MSKFINLFTDFGFKRVFGQEDSKIILIGFLNALFEGEFVIKGVDYRDKEQLPEHRNKRGVIYDIYCTTHDGDFFILEMQNKSQDHFEDRAVYYTSRTISRQGKKGQWDFNYKGVLGIYILNFTQEILRNDFRSDFGIRRLGNDKPENLQVLTNKLRLTFLQMPLFNKTEEECETKLDKWIYIMKNLDILNDVPWREQEEAFNAIAEIAEYAAMTQEEQNQYDDALQELQDTYATFKHAENTGRKAGLEEGHKAGLEEGHKAGLEEGREKEKLAIASNMLASGSSVQFVMQCTGLSEKEIEAIK